MTPTLSIIFLGHPVSEFASTNDLETVAWGMEPPYDVALNIALDSFSGSAVVVDAYGTVSGHPGRLRVPVVFPAGATNGVAGVCGESGASPAWSTRSFYEFYRQDPGWDFLYKFEVDHAGVRPFGEPEPDCFPPTTGRLLKSAFGTSPDGQEGGAFIEFRSGSLDDDYIKVPKYECFRIEGHAPFSRYWFGEETIDDRQNICVLDANAGTKEKSIRSTEAVDLGGCTQGWVCAIFNGSVKGSRCRENSLCHEIGHRLGLNYSPSVPWQKHIDGMIQTPSHRGLAYDQCVMSYLSNKMDNNVGFCIDCLSHQTENRFEVGLRCTEE